MNSFFAIIDGYNIRGKIKKKKKIEENRNKKKRKERWMSQVFDQVAVILFMKIVKNKIKIKPNQKKRTT